MTKHASWRLSSLFACFGWLVLTDAIVQGKMTGGGLQFNLNIEVN